ncbi:type II toxin-antitoxin system RelE/ParE family toxin [Bartonella sp. DGB1]|uniref:type II toxin-antitoxin system RelE/ParE family toxin n=1 Tax=Bartonella sp. DGB1 TaxID=3239807 RepID=UPI003524616D
MIISFKHKGLKIFYETGSTRGIQASHAKKLRQILSILDLARDTQAFNLPMYHLHPLEGNLKGYYSVRVNANWRITFRFIGTDVELVDYQDYH